MASFKTITAKDIKTSTSNLNQLCDFIAEDMSGSSAANMNTRKKYQVFVTGGVGPGITSSLFQTIYDQGYVLQTANETYDISFGIRSGSSIVANSIIDTDYNKKMLFPSESVMMREKIDIYNQYAQILLGNSAAHFTAPFSSTDGVTVNTIDVPLFINFKRLFVRDGIKRETFAMRFYKSASAAEQVEDGALSAAGQDNIFRGTTSGSVIFTDVGSASSLETDNFGGSVGNIVNSENTAETVGVIFYHQGIVVLDLEKITSGSQKMSGSIDAVGNSAGKILMGTAGQGNSQAKFIPDFVVSASIDNVLDHIASTRFGSGSETFLTFQNNTQINSTLVFCRAEADEFNFSSNPTYTDSTGRIRVIDQGQENVQTAFSFITSVGLYDANAQLLAVAKLSRPVEKNNEKDLTFRIRLDF